MKKLFFIASIAALTLTGCASQEGPQAPATATSDEAAEIGFDFRTANMSRGTTAMEEAYLEFGVYAAKANNVEDIVFTETADNNSTVMYDYLVGSWDGTKGYKPEEGQNLFESTWYYQGLGSASKGTKYTWTNGGDSFFKEMTSRQNYQFLKYFDKSKTYTYFYGFAPYNKAVDVVADNDNSLVTMTWKEAITANSTTTSTQPDFMYAVTKVANADYTTKDATNSVTNPKKVTMQFNHMLARIRVAFYEAIDGYDVYLQDFSTTQNDLVARPTQKSGDAYSLGYYAETGTPTVVFNEAGFKSLTFTNTTVSTADIVIPLQYFNNKSDYSEAWLATNNVKLGTTYGDCIYSATCDVLPAQNCYDGSATPALITNDGFTLNVTLKLVARDTHEVVYVRGARVFIPSDFTQWQPNKLYTYVFRVTHMVSGSTGTTDPYVGLGPTDPALFPIMFDGVTVSDYTEALNGEWDLNPEVEGNHEPDNAGHNGYATGD